MSLAEAATPPSSGLLADWRRQEPVFFAAALTHAALIPVALALMAVDGRTYLDLNIWVKPLKFLVSLAIWFGFLVWATGWLPSGATAKRWWRPFTIVMVSAAALEMIYLGGAAALGTGSHFNVSTLAWRLAFNAAAVMAVVLTSASLVYGALIIRDRAGPLPPRLPACDRARISARLSAHPHRGLHAGRERRAFRGRRGRVGRGRTAAARLGAGRGRSSAGALPRASRHACHAGFRMARGAVAPCQARRGGGARRSGGLARAHGGGLFRGA